MHYCVHLLTKELPSENKIAEIMKPYNSELIYDSDDEEDKQIDYPVFTWDYYQIGGRYKPEWMYHEEDWFMNMGFGDGYILVDGAKQSDVLNINKLGCYVCILPDGSAIAKDSWNGKDIIKDEKFDEKYKQAITDNMDGFITVLDIHD